ncbi:MAG: RNA polymerase sigma factor [Candidatus Sumerlaeaceae bacterium]|nr:RNA polymerase sigma factor [Candidatus Sumerlaeaceae bacterium]
MSVALSNAAAKTDAELVAEARLGRRDAFDELAARHFGVVYAIGLARLGNRDQAEDLVQEVFLRAFLLLDQLASPGLFSHWLARMARNLAIDWQRRGDAASRLIPMVPLEEVPAEVANPRAENAREEAARTEQSTALQMALASLRPESRELVLLHYMEGISHEEIARRMGVHQSTVSRQIQKSVASMRGFMETSLSAMARGLSARPAAQARTALLGAAVLALPAATKSSLAQAAAAAAGTATSGKTALASLSLIKTGALFMGYGKAVATVAAVAVLAGGGYYFTHQEKPLPPPPAASGERVPGTDAVSFNGTPAVGKRLVIQSESITDTDYQLPPALAGKIPGGGGGGKMRMRTVEDLAFTIKAVKPDGGKTIELEVLGMGMDSDLPGNKISVGSGTLATTQTAGKPADMQSLTGITSSMVGQKFTAQLSPTGEILSIDGMSALLDSFKASIAKLPAAFSGYLGGTLNEDTFKTKFGLLLTSKGFPNSAVKIGDTWNTKDEYWGKRTGYNSDRAYKFTGWRTLNGHRVAEVQFEVRGTGKSKNPTTLMPNGMKYDDASQVGTFLYDPELGAIADFNALTTMDMSMDIPMPGAKSPVTMKMQVKSTNKTTLLPDQPAGGQVAAAK